MDETQIKQMIADSIASALKDHSKALLDDVTAYVENRTQALEDTVRAGSVAAEAVTPPVADDSALTARLALLEKELNETKTARQQQEEESKRLKFEGSIKSAVSTLPGVLHADVLGELMYNRLSQGYTVKDNVFITKNGKTVDEELSAFVATDAGKHFLAPKQQAKGADSPTPTRNQVRVDNARTLTNALLRRP